MVSYFEFLTYIISGLRKKKKERKENLLLIIFLIV